MTTTPTYRASSSMRLAVALTIVALAVAFFGTADFYLVEDDNPLTGEAFDAIPLLGVSLLLAHLSLVVALMVIVVGVARVAVGLWKSTHTHPRAFLFTLGVSVASVATLCFTALSVRTAGSIMAALTGGSRAASSAAIAASLTSCTVAVVAVVHKVARQQQRRFVPGGTTATLLPFCIGVLVALLANCVAVALHTASLWLGSPELFADSVDRVVVSGHRFAWSFSFSEFVLTDIVTSSLVVGTTALVARLIIRCVR